MINIGWILSGAAVALVLLLAIITLVVTGRADQANLDSAKLTVLAGKVVVGVILLIVVATVAAWVTLTSVQ